ncbi:MAG: hypothetical protein ACK4MM_05790 [Fervidobacterium sp.]
MEKENKSCDHKETTIRHVDGKIQYVCVKCGKVVKVKDLFAEQVLPKGQVLHG